MLNVKPQYTVVERITTGDVGADFALGGGWVRGAIQHLYGDEHTGKSVLAYKGIGEVIKAGGRGLLIDSEHTLEQRWAARFMGLDSVDLIQPVRNGEVMTEFILEMVIQNTYDIIVLDSYDALLFNAEGSISSDSDEMRSKLWRTFLRTLYALISSRKTAFLVVSQVRQAIDNPFLAVAPSGGKLLNRLSVIQVRMNAPLHRRDKLVLRFTTTQNKTAKNFRNAAIEIGVDE